MTNLIHSYYDPRLKTEDKTEVSTNSLRSVKLAGLTSLIKLLYVINLGLPISLVLKFMKCKLIQKMLMLIVCPLKDGRDLIRN